MQNTLLFFRFSSFVLHFHSLAFITCVIDPTKQATLVNDVNGDNKTTVGDTIEYKIEIFSFARFSFPLFNGQDFRVLVEDTLPSEVTYVDDSTQYELFNADDTSADSGTITDVDGSPPTVNTSFPLDPSNGGWPNTNDGILIPPLGALAITFEVTVNADALDEGVDETGCKSIVNEGTVSFGDATSGPNVNHSIAHSLIVLLRFHFCRSPPLLRNLFLVRYLTFKSCIFFL